MATLTRQTGMLAWKVTVIIPLPETAMQLTDEKGEPFVIVRMACGYLWRMTIIQQRYTQVVNRDQFRKIAHQAYGLKGNLSCNQLLPKW
ncbi:hypothetical protein [Pantoea ananatis]